jgi:hypothetical protein
LSQQAKQQQDKSIRSENNVQIVKEQNKLSSPRAVPIGWRGKGPSKDSYTWLGASKGLDKSFMGEGGNGGGKYQINPDKGKDSTNGNDYHLSSGGQDISESKAEVERLKKLLDTLADEKKSLQDQVEKQTDIIYFFDSGSKKGWRDGGTSQVEEVEKLKLVGLRRELYEFFQTSGFSSYNFSSLNSVHLTYQSSTNLHEEIYKSYKVGGQSRKFFPA